MRRSSTKSSSCRNNVALRRRYVATKTYSLLGQSNLQSTTTTTQDIEKLRQTIEDVKEHKDNLRKLLHKLRHSDEDMHISPFQDKSERQSRRKEESLKPAKEPKAEQAAESSSKKERKPSSKGKEKVESDRERKQRRRASRSETPESKEDKSRSSRPAAKEPEKEKEKEEDKTPKEHEEQPLPERASPKDAGQPGAATQTEGV